MPNGYNRTNGGECGIHKPQIISLNKEASDVEKISIGALLKKRRIELSLTQRQIANQVGVTEATISRWESGDIDNMRRDKIASLAMAFKVSPLLIMGIDDVENLYKPVNKDELELLSDYRDVDAEDRNMVRGMLKRFKIGRCLVSNHHAAVV